MPPSIDPVTNIFNTGAGLFKRIGICFVAGWAGNLVGALSAAFTEWSDFTGVFTNLGGMISEMGIAEHVSLALWPLMMFYFLIEAPLYFLILVIVLAVCLIKIVFGDGDYLFWAVLMATSIAPGLVITDGSPWSLIPLGFFMIGLIAALWYGLQLDYPDLAERMGHWFNRNA